MTRPAPGLGQPDPARTGAPRVSVIAIFFNPGVFLGEAIESVLAQDCSDYELILVDDGSSDGNSEVARAFAERHPARVRYIHHSAHANRGMSASRNLGLSQARGEFIAFIDADDRWAPEKLGAQLAILDAQPEVDAVCGSVVYWRSWDGGQDQLVPTGHVRGRPIEPPEASLAFYPLGQAAAPCPSDLMVRRSAALAVGGFEETFTGDLQMYEDQAFLAKLYLQHTIFVSDACWLHYRRHDRSCVAQVSRAGGYHAVRRHFLEWFQTYLRDSGGAGRPAVMAAVQRALRPYRGPDFAVPIRLATRVLRKLRAA